MRRTYRPENVKRGSFMPAARGRVAIEYATSCAQSMKSFTTGLSVRFFRGTLAGAFGNLRDVMMLAIVGAVVSFTFALMLPEAVGRRFAVVEDVVEIKEKFA